MQVNLLGDSQQDIRITAGAISSMVVFPILYFRLTLFDVCRKTIYFAYISLNPLLP